ncbi:Yip1 family protein [Phytopseudomonas dryadis]|uniref:YIP1 family protein n=1 Tax=Phytopseudomonas dryadis TaxID=2487520 RepID=A0A4Q9R2C8_9GAMM|nr:MULTISPECIES: Yip1 family protein [Pseudomonas]TBU93443.1 YIP1 family protein [Pseudomonas dryadis]TBV07048.1 YIP1 family protein [Pseudomonas dryadis]TBV19558.1 YIP1 family protein [Pseudomonas sp. FRB 230]
MFNHFTHLMTRPDQAWLEIRRNQQDDGNGYLAYLLVLTLLPAVCLFIGTHLVGWSLVDQERIRLATGSALLLSTLLYLSILLGVLIMAGFLRWMSRSFEAHPTFAQCIAFVAYTCTPFFIAGLGALYPTRAVAIVVLLLAGLHATYLLYVGLPTFMRIDSSRGLLYGSAALGVGLLVLVNVKVGMILLWLAMGPTYERDISADQSAPTLQEQPREAPVER